MIAEYFGLSRAYLAFFSSIVIPRNQKQPMTTEQALRQLRILGLTKDDEPIARTLVYMEHNLLRPHPTVFHEKKHSSKTYGDLMLAAWIRLFDPDNNAALSIAKKWAKVITCAFQSGEYSHAEYVIAYESEFTKLNPKAGCLADFGWCYYAPFYIDLASYFNFEIAKLYYNELIANGISLNYDDFYERYRAAVRYSGFIYLCPSVRQWSLRPTELTGKRLLQMLKIILTGEFPERRINYSGELFAKLLKEHKNGILHKLN